MIGIGIEVEFIPFIKDGGDYRLLELSDFDIERIGASREYYAYMYEFNIFNQKKERISSLFKYFQNELEKNLSKLQNGMIVPLKSLIAIKYNSIISNGIHVHIELPSKYKTSPFTEVYEKYLSALVVNEKMKFNPSVRSIYSHHIWGKWRNSSFSFKKKKKFSPVYISPPKENKPLTVEVRVFDVEDLFLYSSNFVSTIKKVIKSIMNPNKHLPHIDLSLFNKLCTHPSEWIFEDEIKMYDELKVNINEDMYVYTGGKLVLNKNNNVFDKIWGSVVGDLVCNQVYEEVICVA